MERNFTSVNSEKRKLENKLRLHHICSSSLYILISLSFSRMRRYHYIHSLHFNYFANLCRCHHKLSIIAPLDLHMFILIRVNYMKYRTLFNLLSFHCWSLGIYRQFLILNTANVLVALLPLSVITHYLIKGLNSTKNSRTDALIRLSIENEEIKTKHEFQESKEQGCQKK